MKYIGIDWGEKRIGLALGDSEIKIASPFKVVNKVDEIIKIIKDEEIGAIIIGEPKPMSNAEYKMSKKYADFLKELKEKIKIKIYVIDERLTSKAADALVGDKKTKSPRDAIAAMIILQSWFDKK
jgi:putative Holliday junction resolvase